MSRRRRLDLAAIRARSLMDLQIVLAARQGPIWTDTDVIFMATQQWRPSRQWCDPLALWYKTKDADTFHEGAQPIPVDPDFVISRVKAANCPWADVPASKLDPALPWREYRVEYCLEPNANGFADYERASRREYDFIRRHYQCDLCGLRSTDDYGIEQYHPVKDVYLRSGFGFDATQSLFIASDEPGTLMLLASIKPDAWWQSNPPRASIKYAQRHGMLSNWVPLYEGSLPKGTYSACSFMVLRANQAA
jgi:hypothetical protein